MANGTITGDEVFKGVVERTKQVNEELKKTLATYNELAGVIRNTSSASGSNSNAKTANEVNTKTNALLTEKTRLLKAIESAQAKQNLSTSNAAKILANQRVELQATNKANRDAATIANKNIGLYKRQSTELNRVRDRYKSLYLQQKLTNDLTKKETRELKRLEIQLKKLDSALKKTDAAAGQFNRNVGNYPKGLRSAAGALRSFAGAFGFTSGIFLFASALKNSLKRVREFDKSMQNLAGVLRVTRSDVADIEAEVIKVAGASIKTSREVASLAETLATLGKRGQDLKDLIKPANDLSIALGATSDEAAEFLVQTLNAFGEPSSKAKEFADTIATIRTSTTLDFQKMRDSFQYLTPISRVLGKDLAYTGSILGVLADNGLKAEQAGRLLGTAQQKLGKEGNTLNGALQAINDATAKGVEGYDLLKIASGLFGKQAAKVAIILANNSDSIETNAEAIRNNGGALDDLVNQQLESLDAKLKILDSTWEQLILTVENGEGSISRFFKGSAIGVTGYLEELIKAEKAEGDLYDTLGKTEKDFGTDWFSFRSSAYDDLILKQREFNRYLGQLSSETSISFLADELDSLRDVLKNTTDLTDDQRKVYFAQTQAVEELYNSNVKLRSELEDQVLEIINITGKFGEFGDKIDILTNKQLQEFITANKNAAKSLEEINQQFGEGSFNSLNAFSDKLKELKRTLGETDVDSALFQTLKREIADLQSKISAAQGKTNKAIENAISGSIGAFQKLIAEEKKVQKNEATTREAYLQSVDKIREYQKEIDKLARGFADLDKIDVSSLISGVTPAIGDVELTKELADRLNDISGLDLKKAQKEMKEFGKTLVDLGLIDDIDVEAATGGVDTSAIPGANFYAEFLLYKADTAAKKFEEEQKTKITKEQAALRKGILEESLRAAQNIYGIDLESFISILGDKDFAELDNHLKVIAYAEASREALSSINDSILDATTRRFDEQENANRASLERVLNDEGSTQEQRKSAQKKYDAQALAIKQKQFKADQKAKKAQVIINTAVAILQAYAQLGPIGGTIAGVIITGLSLLQMSNIDKQKPPQYFKGKKGTDTSKGDHIASVNELSGQREYRINAGGEIEKFGAGMQYQMIGSKDIIVPSLDELQTQMSIPNSEVSQRLSKNMKKDTAARNNMYVVNNTAISTEQMERVFRAESRKQTGSIVKALKIRNSTIEHSSGI